MLLVLKMLALTVLHAVRALVMIVCVIATPFALVAASVGAIAWVALGHFPGAPICVALMGAAVYVALFVLSVAIAVLEGLPTGRKKEQDEPFVAPRAPDGAFLLSIPSKR